MTLQQIRKLIADDIKAVDQLILDRLSSDVVLINQIGHYIINSGGKRLRPLLTLLSARACGYQGTDHHLMAAVIEFIHTSTLLHDDVVDESDTRRGNKTANEVWGNAASVLVGDFLYSRSFEMMVEPGIMRIMQVMSAATNVIAEGEVLQLLNVHDASTTEERYMEVIHRKTAKLFEAATQMGPILAEKPELEEAFIAYGRHLGAAFQLVDDALDYTADAEELGKNIGDDLAEGKPTLPLIYIMQKGTEEERELVRRAIESDGITLLHQVSDIIQNSGAIEYTYEIARQEAQTAQEALASLDDSELKQALLSLADLAVNRSH
ncbi:MULTISPECIES: octaprenyl diphosphate synthase [Thiomicrorhabdus]|uniref:Octaprenyl diphosphate synthase n=1 Tax=Thiomicrorhabdus xiamenensis TaxID=2739063 RepID=A0A7D4SZC3_9GAMM|nr:MULTISPECIES: octaprenyl diphosphate synthase [Thiomicrorhabdus]MBO1923944.1 octaprenyl diphosphate synthase [Thiomicrorhabdus sp. 6S3-12]QKI88462.1 octaprenyl diphosphate synthase [Thiomicrorhabdus xiamenensis]